MKKQHPNDQSRFPVSTFWIVLAVLLLTSGISMGIVIGMQNAGWVPILQTHIMVIYWIGAALFLTWLIRSRMKVVYDTPMQRIFAATKQVAHGDFTVRIEPLHSEEKEDYLDLMIHDLNAMIAELGSIETLKTDFISNVSHEMKTPLSAIRNYTHLLQSSELSDADRIEYAASAENAAVRMNELITNILRLSKLENSSLQPRLERIDLSAMLSECVLLFENIWEEKEINLDIDIADEISAESDPDLLPLVFHNLLSNAFKFSGKGDTVRVCLSNQDGHPSVIIQDTGIGMDEKTVTHIFDKFYQGDSSHSTQGNGLGVALVKRILDLLSGKISVQSKLGEGTSFTVTF